MILNFMHKYIIKMQLGSKIIYYINIYTIYDRKDRNKY